MPRLFVAVDMPEDVKDRLLDVQEALPGARWTPADQIHLTLAFLGDVDGGMARDVEEALAHVVVPELDLELAGVGHFPPRGQPNVLWVGVRANPTLTQLHRAVERELSHAGCKLERRKFHPHVTVARLRDVPERAVAGWLASWGTFSMEAFRVEAFQLYSSVLGRSGATHRLECEYPLDAVRP